MSVARRPAYPFWAMAPLAAVSAFALLTGVEYATSAVSATFWPHRFELLLPSQLFDSDLWSIVGLTFLVIAVLAFCGALLAEVLQRRANRASATLMLRRAFWFSVMSATLIASMSMVVATLVMIRLIG